MLTYNLTQRKDESKYYYIYKSIRRDIEGGTLKKGEKLPSKRSLAEHLGVSLITIENAYQMLKDEGYIEPRERSGYYVCEIHATISEAAGSCHSFITPPNATSRRFARALSRVATLSRVSSQLFGRI